MSTENSTTANSGNETRSLKRRLLRFKCFLFFSINRSALGPSLHASVAVFDHDFVELVGTLKVQRQLLESAQSREDQKIVQPDAERESCEANAVRLDESVDRLQSSRYSLRISAANLDSVNLELLRKAEMQSEVCG